ncbi:hypothetical protein [Oscillibacter sp.]|uniref:hypothetical protein n=1 Tax=Oscillibacter sp. TaxID=1945593 RepID=UPI003397CB27
MAVFSRSVGELPEDPKKAVKVLLDYIAYMQEQIEFNDSGVKKRLKSLESK